MVVIWACGDWLMHAACVCVPALINYSQLYMRVHSVNVFCLWGKLVATSKDSVSDWVRWYVEVRGGCCVLLCPAVWFLIAQLCPAHIDICVCISCTSINGAHAYYI